MVDGLGAAAGVGPCLGGAGMVGGDVQSTWMPPTIKHKAATWPEAGQKNTVEVDRSARHTRPMIHHAHPGSWDGSWYRVHTEHFEAAFLPNAA